MIDKYITTDINKEEILNTVRLLNDNVIKYAAKDFPKSFEELSDVDKFYTLFVLTTLKKIDNGMGRQFALILNSVNFFFDAFMEINNQCSEEIEIIGNNVILYCLNKGIIDEYNRPLEAFI